MQSRTCEFFLCSLWSQIVAAVKQNYCLGGFLFSRPAWSCLWRWNPDECSRLSWHTAGVGALAIQHQVVPLKQQKQEMLPAELAQPGAVPRQCQGGTAQSRKYSSGWVQVLIFNLLPRGQHWFGNLSCHLLKMWIPLPGTQSDLGLWGWNCSRAQRILMFKCGLKLKYMVFESPG